MTRRELRSGGKQWQRNVGEGGEGKDVIIRGRRGLEELGSYVEKVSSDREKLCVCGGGGGGRGCMTMGYLVEIRPRQILLGNV